MQIKNINSKLKNIIEGFHKYISNDGLTISSNELIINVEEKLKDDEFNGDVAGLIRLEIIYYEDEAREIIKNLLINFI